MNATRHLSNKFTEKDGGSYSKALDHDGAAQRSLRHLSRMRMTAPPARHFLQQLQELAALAVASRNNSYDCSISKKVATTVGRPGRVSGIVASNASCPRHDGDTSCIGIAMSMK